MASETAEEREAERTRNRLHELESLATRFGIEIDEATRRITEAASVAKEAYLMAQVGQGRFDGHEKLCTERWDASRKLLEGVAKAVGTSNRFWVNYVLTTLTSVLLGGGAAVLAVVLGHK